MPLVCPLALQRAGWLRKELSCCPVDRMEHEGWTSVLGGQPGQVGRGHRDRVHPPGEPRQGTDSYRATV